MKTSSTKLVLALFITWVSSSIQVAGQCDNAEHSTNWEDAWVSCSVSENPNSERADSHWIMYDMGDVFSLQNSQIWNFNVNNQTGLGVRNVFFDYSLNGSDWEFWGSMEIQEAPGTDDYVGIPGPDFAGIAARFLLLTVETNWGGDGCSGFAEIRVNREYLGVSIDELEEGIVMSVYPNPTSETLKVRHYQNKSLDMQILNGSGQLILQKRLSGTSADINVSGWTSGLYLLILRDENGNTGIERFVVSH